MKNRIVFLHLKGTQEHPRFLITENGGSFWTGERWSNKESDGLLYANPLDAAETANCFLLEQYADATCFERYTLPIEIEVRSKEGVDEDALLEWIKKALLLHTAYGDYGNGPTEASLVLMFANWYKFHKSQLREERKEPSMHTTQCLCCLKKMRWWGARHCPECNLEFRVTNTTGWEGIEQHWQEHHTAVMSFGTFWDSLCHCHREYETIARSATLVLPLIILEVYLRGGKAEIGNRKNPGKDRDIYNNIAKRLGVTEEEMRLSGEDIYPLFGVSPITPDKRQRGNRNAWDLTMLPPTQHARRWGWLLSSEQRGVWELTADGMKEGERLATEGVHLPEAHCWCKCGCKHA